MTWGKQTSRTKPLPKNWWHARARQLKADNHQCTHTREDTGKRCIAKATDVDHINGVNDENALTSLCKHHHMVKTGKDSHKNRKKHEQPQHPGLI